MNSRIVLVLSLAAVALAGPLHVPEGHHASTATAFSSGVAATDAVVTSLHGDSGAHGWADAHLQATGRTAWATPVAGLVHDHATEAKLAPAGRAAWANDAHLNGDAQHTGQILEQQYEMQPPGGYLYSYKTSNGIEASEHAALKSAEAEEVQGSYSWMAPSGQKFTVNYVADETGYHATGDHIPEVPAAIARSLEWNAAHPEEEASAGMWQGAERASAGRAAWVSKSSANVPAWESAAKIESARIVSAKPAFTTYTASGLAPAARAAWASDATAHGFTGTGATQITKITETKPAFTTYTASGLAPAARSAWASDATTHGFTGTGFTGTGATQITKITETKPAFTTYTASGLAPAARSAWAADAATHGFTGTGFTGTGATQITKITETKPSFTTYTTGFTGTSPLLVA